MSGHYDGKPRWRWMTQAPLSRTSRMLVPVAVVLWAASAVAWLAGAGAAYRFLLPLVVLLFLLAAVSGMVDTYRAMRDRSRRPRRPSGGA